MSRGSDSGRGKEIEKVVKAAGDSGLRRSEVAPSSEDLHRKIANPELKWHRDVAEYPVDPDDEDTDWYEDGCVYWALLLCDSYQDALNRGLLHRDDGPAVIWDSGAEAYYQFGEAHRKDGPALIEQDPVHGRVEIYFERGKKHRSKGPAVVCEDGTKEWWSYGRQHRKEGPAVEGSDGKRAWYEDGELHRNGDLPALIEADGSMSWYHHGRLHRVNGLPAYVSGSGEGAGWFEFGQLHRDDGPACIEADASRLWYQRGKLHRDGDLPAVERPGGTRSYYRDGLEHRDRWRPSSVHKYGEREVIDWVRDGLPIASLALTDYDEACLTVFSSGPGELGETLTEIPEIAWAFAERGLELSSSEVGEHHQDLMRCIWVETLIAAAAMEGQGPDPDAELP